MEGLGNLQLVRFLRPEQARVLIMADTLHPNPVTIRTNRGPSGRRGATAGYSGDEVNEPTSLVYAQEEGVEYDARHSPYKKQRSHRHEPIASREVLAGGRG